MVFRFQVMFFVGLTISSCAGASKVPADGFKKLKYGMSIADIESLGFICSEDNIFKPPESKQFSSFTLLYSLQAFK